MKTLLLMRHADPVAGHNMEDRARSLTGRGQAAASQAGEMLAGRGLAPQVVLCSTALRARQTARLVAAGAGLAEAPRELEQLYLAAPHTLLEVIAGLPDALERALVVGHNPGLSELVSQLSGQPCLLATAELAVLRLNLPGWGGLAGEVRGTWEKI